MSREHFEQLVADALDSLPEDLGRKMENVAVVVSEDGPPGLLGLYQGVPLTSRDNYGWMALPDRITIFQRAICWRCTTDDDVVRQVRITVIHEIGHHFGISDARLHELGWA